MEKEGRVCEVCGRTYYRNFCDYCNRDKRFDVDKNIEKLFTPRIQKRLKELDIQIEDSEVQYLRSGGSIFITGVFGSGKTLYAAKLILECCRLSSVENDRPGPNKFTLITLVDLLDEIRRSFDGEVENPLYKYFENKRLLCIDDLGSEKVTEWALEKLYQIVNYRYEYFLPTIFTSNLGHSDMAKNIGGRIPSRLVEMCWTKKMDQKRHRN